MRDSATVVYACQCGGLVEQRPGVSCQRCGGRTVFVGLDVGAAIIDRVGAHPRPAGALLSVDGGGPDAALAGAVA